MLRGIELALAFFGPSHIMFDMVLKEALCRRRKVLSTTDMLGTAITHRKGDGRFLIRYLNEDMEDIGFDLTIDFESHDEAEKYYLSELRIEKTEA